MKSLYVSIFIFISIIIVSVLSFFKVSEYQEDLTSILVRAETSATSQNYEEAHTEVLDFLDSWKEYDSLLTCLIRHPILDEIESSSAGLLPLLEHNETGEFLSELGKVKALLEIMIDDERVALRNVF